MQAKHATSSRFEFTFVLSFCGHSDTQRPSHVGHSFINKLEPKFERKIRAPLEDSGVLSSTSNWPENTNTKVKIRVQTVTAGSAALPSMPLQILQPMLSPTVP